MKRKHGKNDRGRIGHVLEIFSLKATEWAGTSIAFGIASSVIVLWIASGPLFGFSDTWQLVINTGTTIVTFLMVFLIQRAQNKESRVVQLKLNEIVAALNGASNRLIDVERPLGEGARDAAPPLREAREARREGGRRPPLALDRRGRAPSRREDQGEEGRWSDLRLTIHSSNSRVPPDAVRATADTLRARGW